MVIILVNTVFLVQPGNSAFSPLNPTMIIHTGFSLIWLPCVTGEKQSETHQDNLKKQVFTPVTSALITSGITEISETHYF